MPDFVGGEAEAASGTSTRATGAVVGRLAAVDYDCGAALAFRAKEALAGGFAGA